MNGLQRFKHRIGQLFAAALLVLLLASCGGSDEAAATTSPTESTVTVEPVATTAPVADPTVAIADSSSTTDGVDDHEHSDETHDHDEPDSDIVSSDGAASNGESTADLVANASYLGSYTLIDEGFGTMATVTVEGTTRTIESNTLPNHETGEFPNSGNPNVISEQDRTWDLTTEPVYTGVASMVRETGVALNGVKFEPGTAETVNCESGESYRVEGLQDLIDLGMDFNNAHVQPTGEYHYHGVSELLVDAFDNDADLVLVGFAADGHAMYYSKSNAYPASYELSSVIRSGTGCDYRGTAMEVDGTDPDGAYVSDWAYIDGLGALDECNGTVIDGEYAYLVTDEYPYISRCLMGEVEGETGGPGGAAPEGGEAPGGQAPSGQAPDGQAPGGAADQAAGGPPDLTDAAAALGITAEDLQNALGGPPPDVSAAAESLGMAADELMAVLTEYGVAPPA